MNYRPTEKIILYLINRLGNKIEGRKKLMKLMFLVEHYDIELKKLTRKGLLGNTFLIYYYGVFSSDIKDYVTGMTRRGVIKDGFPLETTEKTIGKIEPEQQLKEKVEKIMSVFGEKSGYQLEVETMRMMGIEPSNKKKFFRKPVSEIIGK